MADWGNGQDDWGNGPKHVNEFDTGKGGDNGFGGDGSGAADAGDTFATGGMTAALDATEDQPEDKPQHVAPMQKDPPKLEGWCQAQKYDYDQYAQNAGGEANWDGNAKTYEWDGEHGEVGPEHPELEKMLFGEGKSPEDMGHGIDFSAITSIKVEQEGPVRIHPIDSFDGAGLHPVMLRNVVLSGYKIPTPIQKYCLPAIHLGHDVIAIAQTGSGKTAAYLVPILNKLMGKAKKLAAPRPNPATFREGIDPPARAEPLVAVLSPTRELAVQIFNEARKFCYRTMLRPCVVYGGGPIGEQINQLQKGCDVLIASPGRLADMIDRPHVLTLRRLRYMVIDEADEMLQDDWKDEFEKILTCGEQEEGNIKYMLFSATFPKAARELASEHLAEDHVRLRVGRAGSTHKNIRQQIIPCSPSMKKAALLDLLIALPATRTVIFVNSKRTADEVDDYLFNQGVPCVSLHSDRTQREREAAMRAFRRGDSPVLITTGVSSRGIDVRSIMHVVNYDLPSMDYGGIEEYIHRIGRTGRIGFRGLASSFFTERDEPIAPILTKILLETDQDIPDCLKEYIPEGYDPATAGETLKFESDSEDGNDDVGKNGDGSAGNAEQEASGW